MKQMKVFSVLAVALALGLAACGGKSGGGDASSKAGGNSSGAPTTSGSAGGNSSGGNASASKSSKHTHTAKEDAPYKFDESRHWQECEAGDGGKVNNKAHTYPEDGWKVVKEASCSEAGSRTNKCSVCGYEVTEEIEKLPHTYAKVKDADGNDTNEDLVVWTKEANCTEGGEGEKECTVCHEKAQVTTEALGHVYAKVKDADGNDTDEDLVVWSKEATCTEAGTGEKECTRCHEKAEVTKAALGHNLQAEPDDGVAPKEDFAKVRRYVCSHGCGKSYFGFNANEVTAASKDHLVINDQGGARFWGRPIGNALQLDEDGTSVNQQNYECVYSKAETSW